MVDIDISLLWTKDKRQYHHSTAPLFHASVESLELDLLCANLCEREEDRKIVKGILTEFCHDEEVIRYRQSIFNDFISSEQLTTAFENVLEALRQLEYMSYKSSIEDDKLWDLFSRYKELEAYVDCVAAIGDAMKGIPLQSKGLLAFREKIELLTQDTEYVALTGIVKSLEMDVNEIKSITIGINLDSSLTPESVVLQSVNKTHFTEQFLLRHAILSVAGVSLDELGLATSVKKLSNDRRDPIMYTLNKEIARYLRPLIKQLSVSLNKFTNIYTGRLADVIPEIVFYLSFAKLHKKLVEHGMACCCPAVADAAKRVCFIEDSYSLTLALHMINEGRDPVAEIVKNRVEFSDSGRVLILTGPNRGGKTVFTEMVGLAQVLFQAGVFVPGSNAEISPVDNIFSHFPADEKETVELGRLGEETKRLGEIFNEASHLSLLLLNESLSSTSYTESLHLAEEIVRSMRYLGARAVYNTHMHSLAEKVCELNDDTSGNSLVQSLVTGIKDGQRSYMVEPGVPLGKSYAMDIALKFGVSFEQIAKVVDEKRARDVG